jgi:hypothetical protein
MEEETTKKSYLHRAGFVFTAVTFGCIGLKLPFVVTVFSRSPSLPYMATPSRKLSLALKQVKRLQGYNYRTAKEGAERPFVFVDLGSGDGEGVLQAARLGYKAIGIELNFTLWAFSNIRRQLFWSASEKQRSKIILGSFFDYHLQRDFDATTVMIFGVAPLMESLSQKLKEELPVGACILSYRFGIPLACYNNGANTSSNLLEANIVYDHQEMRIYQVVSSSTSLHVARKGERPSYSYKSSSVNSRST